MINARRIAALRALAERPGTPAEGEVAREKLARIESKQTRPVNASELFGFFASYLRNGCMEDLQKAVNNSVCNICGKVFPRGLACPNQSEHFKAHSEMYKIFPRGERVYYNYWAYPANCPAVVAGYSADLGWIRLKFDHLKNTRSVPIYDDGELRLFTSPVDSDAADRMRGWS